MALKRDRRRRAGVTDGGQRALRDVVLRRLAELGAAGPLSREQVALVAEGAGVSERTVWRWAALAPGRAESVVRPRLTLDAALRERLVFCHPDLLFALRLSDRPAPAEPAQNEAIIGN